MTMPMGPYVLLKVNTIGTCSWNYRSPIPSGYIEEDKLDDTQSQGKRDDVMDYYDSTPVTHLTPGVKEFMERAFTKSIPKRKRLHLAKEYPRPDTMVTKVPKLNLVFRSALGKRGGLGLSSHVQELWRSKSDQGKTDKVGTVGCRSRGSTKVNESQHHPVSCEPPSGLLTDDAHINYGLYDTMAHRASVHDVE